MNDFLKCRSVVGVAVFLAVLCLPGGVMGAGLPVNGKKVPETREDLEEIQGALVGGLARVREAVVSIRIGEKGFGSGVIVSPDGLVLTAAHVTGTVGKELVVILNDGTKLKAVSMGLVSDTDAAMMRITEKGVYPYVEINRENDYRLGHWVFALGHSGGFDKERGPVARLGRIVKEGETTLHTDCKVIGGDSGGPLFDMEGRLIGIHSRVSGSMEENMHVPVREYLRHWEEMREGKFLGDGPFAKRPVKGGGFLGFDSTFTEKGLLVGKVLKDGPADKAGVEAGDIVLKVDGKGFDGKAGFKAILKEKAAGEKVALLVLRGGEEREITVVLGER